MPDTGISTEILGQITLLQSTVILLPELQSQINMITHGLEDLPGIGKAIFSYKTGTKSVNTNEKIYPIKYRKASIACFILQLENQEYFAPYEPFIENLMNMLGVILAEHKQRTENEKLTQKLEDHIKERTEELEELFDLTPVGIGVMDYQGNIIKINKRFIELFGYDLNDFSNIEQWQPMAYPDEQYRMESLNRWNKDLSRALKDGTSTPVREYIIHCKNGTDLVIEMEAKPGEEKILVVFNDVTERSLAREKLRQGQKLRIIGQLAGGIAHDINNMLGGIVGSAELLKQELEPGSCCLEFVETILDAADRATDLTRNLLSFSRKQKIELEPLDIHEVINLSVKLLKNTLDKRIKLKQILNAGNSTISGDKTQLQTVIMNLAINSSQAMPEGGDLEIRTENSFQAPQLEDTIFLPGEYIKVSVKDTGTGIKEEDLAKVFEPFFTTKDIGKGTGLGLAAVYGIIQQHHGKIDVHSKLGKGTEIEFFLPLVKNSQK